MPSPFIKDETLLLRLNLLTNIDLRFILYDGLVSYQ